MIKTKIKTKIIIRRAISALLIAIFVLSMMPSALALTPEEIAGLPSGSQQWNGSGNGANNALLLHLQNEYTRWNIGRYQSALSARQYCREQIYNDIQECLEKINGRCVGEYR